MADLRKIKKEKGSVLVPGANRLRRGVNFAVEVPQGVQASLVLYKKNARKPSVEIPFTEKDRTGDICAVTLPDLKIEDYQYNFLLDGKVYTDPWAYRIYGRERFGADMDTDPHKIRCGFLNEEEYDWEGDENPVIPYHEMLLYKLHVRGYTKANRNITSGKGTFQALTEMIPYWKELGINTIELMPAYEFMETQPAVSAEGGMVSEKRREGRVNFWGYMQGYYFAPKRSYCATSEPEREFRDMIKALHKAGIACVMEMYFPGGTNPVLGLRALQFWRLYYHVDGFHVMGDGVPWLLLVQDAVLADTKLMFQGFDEKVIRRKKLPAE